MARIVNGLIKGKLGGVIYRIYNGKQFVSTPPVKITPPDTEEYRGRLSLFSLCRSLCGAINSVKGFSESWRNSKVKAALVMNKIFISNYPRIKPGFDISGVWLVDNFKYAAELKQYNFAEENFTAVLAITSAPGLSQLVSLQGIVELLNPLDPLAKPYKFFPVVSPDYNFIPGEDITFTTNFSSQDIELLKVYSGRKILFNLAYKNIGCKVLGFTGSKYL